MKQNTNTEAGKPVQTTDSPAVVHERLVRHLLKYGGCWIFALIVYATLMWGIPWKLGGTPWAVLIAHGAVAFFTWILYGMGAFDGDL